MACIRIGHTSQATLLETVGSRAQTRLSIVESVDAALSAIDREVPQLVLTSALMPPRDEGVLFARLRSLPRETVPQVLIMPALASVQPEPPRSLFSRMRKRAVAPADCDPSAFADQLSAYLKQADRRRYDTWEPQPQSLRFMPSRGVTGAPFAIRAREWAVARVNGTAVDLVDLSPAGQSSRR
jgi:CheY-like chemotaxis protein